MLRRFQLCLILAGAGQGAVVIDRMVVVVGKHVIKASDIDRDLRVTDFLNRASLDLGSAAKRKSAERLIDQQIIRDEIATGGYRRPADADAEAFEKKLENDRFHGSAAQLNAALAQYGLTEDQLREALLWQLTVLRFIDERFRPGVMVTDEEVKNYYDQHLADLRKQNPRGSSLEDFGAQIRSTLEGERINKNFDEWLDEARRRYRIEYKQEAFE
jgi:peptidyl-prolyl cis-trans isomerase SurA